MINKSEAKIIKNWQGDISQPVVSICCITYNHEKYISEAIDSFLMQETNFPFEIIVRDDASTDNTANIIRRYEREYPKIIKPIYELENGYQKGIKPLATAVRKAKGEYIAICEGDDFWINVDKLQKQVVLLNQYPNINFCFHKAQILNMITQQAYENESYINHDGIISADTIIATLDKLMVPTASIMVRATIIEDVHNYITKRPWLSVGDFYFRIFGVANGGGLYINSTMSVYRYFTPGSWTVSYVNQQTNKINHAKNAIDSFLELDRFLEYKFTAAFSAVTRSMIVGILSDRKIFLKYRWAFLFTIFKRIQQYRSINLGAAMLYIIIKSQIKSMAQHFLSFIGYKK